MPAKAESREDAFWKRSPVTRKAPMPAKAELRDDERAAHAAIEAGYAKVIADHLHAALPAEAAEFWEIFRQHASPYVLETMQRNLP